MEAKPIFTHDCTGCIFLGTYEWPGDQRCYDLYLCNQGQEDGRNKTLIARFGHDGPDYTSGFEMAKMHFQTTMNTSLISLKDADFTPLGEAYRRYLLLKERTKGA